jgi:predicted SAM-dependent methyltransferase
MKSQWLKNCYYATFAKLSILSYMQHRVMYRANGCATYLNVGSGPKYVEGMVNIDGNILRKKDLWLDVAIGLPFPRDSVTGIYASHLLEHFDANQARKLLAEFHRVLKRGGAVRLIVPSLQYAIRAYQEEAPERLPGWPDTYLSIGGRFNNFLLCRNQHRTMFDFTLMEELLKEAGFDKIACTLPQSSRWFLEAHMQYESDPSLKDVSLYVEAVKE